MKRVRICIGFMLALSLGACASTGVFRSIEKVDQAKIERVAIATFFHDLVRGWAELGFAHVERFPATPVKWESNERAEQTILTDLNRAGITAIIVSDIARRIKPENVVGEEGQLEIEIAKELSRSPSFEKVDFFLIATPNAVDFRGQQYSAFSDFLTSGLLGLAIGAGIKDESYHPAFMFSIQTFEPSNCLISYDLSVIDGKSFEMIGQAKSVLAREEVPSEIWASSYATMLSNNQTLLRDRCLLGLEKSLQETLRKLGVIPKK